MIKINSNIFLCVNINANMIKLEISQFTNSRSVRVILTHTDLLNWGGSVPYFIPLDNPQYRIIQFTFSYCLKSC